MENKYLRYQDITSYKSAFELSTVLYKVVSQWNWFDKRTAGAQLIDACDSIGANIAEGFGRYHKKDKEKFYYNARGSAFEVLHWLHLAVSRRLLSDSDYKKVVTICQRLPQEINYLIKITEEKLKF